MPQVTIPDFSTFNSSNRATAVYADTEAVEVSTDDITVIIGSAVPLWRQRDIFSAIHMLTKGLKNRALLSGEFFGAAVFTTVSVNDISIANRRTSTTSVAASFDDTVDIAIAIGAAANQGYTVPLTNAIGLAGNILLEEFKDQDSS